MKEFRLPDPGEGLVEADIVRWLVTEGDTVKINDILVEIETSKSLVELPSPYAGTVARLLVQEGQTVDVGTPIIFIDDGEPDGSAPADEPVQDVSAPRPDEPDAGEVPRVPDEPGAPAASGPEQGAAQDRVPDERVTAQVPDAPPAATETDAFLVGYGVKSTAVARRPRKSVPTTGHIGPLGEQLHESFTVDNPVSRRIDEATNTPKSTAEPVGEPLPQPGRPARPATGTQRAKAKPAVRRLARDLGLTLDSMTGTGPDGTITAEDVVAAAAPSAPSSSDTPVVGGEETRVPLRGVRREMARSMTASLQVPQATAWVEADVTATMDLVDTLRRRKEFDGLRVSPLIIFAKASCLAIAKNPDINSSLDAEAEEIVQHHDVNLGIAAATPRGLLVPNIKQANRMNLVQLAEALNQMVRVAREGKVSPQDMARGTFTITNVGVFGIDGGTPILNQGESAIMCLGTITRKPWVIGTGEDERIEPRSTCVVTLTFDHRVVDGEIASRFLNDVATILANPGLALMY